jgi:uncharacterized delta-60 repeat protein/uncharacterized repeat protein (TIGR01451 family)
MRNTKRKILSTIRIIRGLGFILAATLMATAPLSRVSADAGDLDTSFGTNGFAVAQLQAGENSLDLFDVAIQADGKIVAAGLSGSYANTDVTLIRYNANGSLDTTFGAGGMVKTDFFGFRDSAHAVAIQTNGKIVVGGRAAIDQSHGHFMLARYNLDGTLDTTFGSGGKVVSDYEYVIEDIAIQPNGRIVAVGWTIANIEAPGSSQHNFVVLRYNANGSLDSSFDTNGIVETDVSGYDDLAFSVIIQSDNRILVGGGTKTLAGPRFAMARYNADGSLDSTFGTAGKVTADVSGIEDASEARKIAQLPNGRILLAGSVENGDRVGFALARFNSNGSLDTTFGFSGTATTFFSEAPLIYCVGLEVMTNGKIVLGGYFPNAPVFVLTRYNANGTPDTLFGDNGKVITYFPDDAVYLGAIATYGYDQILAAGRTVNNQSGQLGYGLARYQGDGVLRRADLSVAMSSAITQDTFGNRFIQYIITVTNNGPDEARYVALSARTPASTTFSSLLPAAGWVNETPAIGNSGLVKNSKAALAFGQSATIKLMVKVNPFTPPGTLIRCTANVSTAMNNDPNSPNNQATVQTTWN